MKTALSLALLFFSEIAGAQPYVGVGLVSNEVSVTTMVQKERRREDPGVGLTLGYRFTPAIASEISYAPLAGLSDTRFLSASAVAAVNLGSRFALLGKAGIAKVQGRLIGAPGDVPPADGRPALPQELATTWSGYAPIFGAGVQASVTKDVAVRGMIERVGRVGNMDSAVVASAGLVFSF